MVRSASYSPLLSRPSLSSGTGFDQLLDWIATDPGLAGNSEGALIRNGLTAVNGLNRLLVQGLKAIGAWNRTMLTNQDIMALNAWFREPSRPERLQQLQMLRGDGGFQGIRNSGGSASFDGRNLIDTVIDGLFQLGAPLSPDRQRLNPGDGSAGAGLADLARWLTALRQDPARSGTGLDRLVEMLVADPGLQASGPWTDLRTMAEAADRLNGLIAEGMAALRQAGADDADPTRLSTAEVAWINGWIRRDPARLARFVSAHGNDGPGPATGLHRLPTTKARSGLFNLNAVRTVADGVYHLGFALTADGRFLNEDGLPTTRLEDVAEWLSYFCGDPSTTGSGLDRLVDWIRLDPGLSGSAPARQINDGLAAADGLNRLFLEALAATGVNGDGWISRTDLRQISAWVRANRLARFEQLHGNDENGVATGFHLIQGDGGTSQLLGRSLVNTVADGLYHFGFEIRGDNVLNEDGSPNQLLSDLSGWANTFLGNRRLMPGNGGADTLQGSGESEQLIGYGDDDSLDGQGGDDLLDGGRGQDSLRGGAGRDLLDGGGGDDRLDGGEDGDTYLVSGRLDQGAAFEGYDSYLDSGRSGSDVIRAEGTGPVDIGLRRFGPASGIERIINATSDGARVRLLGTWEANLIDLSATELVGGGFLIEGGGGADTLRGSAGADTLHGGGDNDLLDGADGGDTYLVGGSDPNWSSDQPYTFEGYNTYSDSGSSGVDGIRAEGTGPVDIGLRSFSPASGIERIINATSDGARVRLLGNGEANRLDFSATELVGRGFVIDGGGGADSLRGTSGADTLHGGGDNDQLDGGDGGDTYLVSGAGPVWQSGQSYTFEGFDTYSDSGSSGVDVIRAEGPGPVDIGLSSFGPASGIERIEASAGTGMVRLLGDWRGNSLDFSQVSISGEAMRIDAGDGNDTVVGSGGDDTIVGGRGLDLLSGGPGSDTFVYTTLSDGLIGGSPSAPLFERITDFVVGTDRFEVPGIPLAGAIRHLSSVNSLTVAGISALLPARVFPANSAVTFNAGSGSATRTFIAFNDANAGFTPASDAVLEVTGWRFAPGLGPGV